MAQTMVNFRMDDELKKNMEDTCKEMGLTLTAAFTLFAVKVTKERRIPFEITADPFYSEQNISYLEQKMRGYKEGTLKVAERGIIEDY